MESITTSPEAIGITSGIHGCHRRAVDGTIVEAWADDLEAPDVRTVGPGILQFVNRATHHGDLTANSLDVLRERLVPFILTCLSLGLIPRSLLRSKTLPTGWTQYRRACSADALWLAASSPLCNVEILRWVLAQVGLQERCR